MLSPKILVSVMKIHYRGINRVTLSKNLVSKRCKHLVFLSAALIGTEIPTAGLFLKDLCCFPVTSGSDLLSQIAAFQL